MTTKPYLHEVKYYETDKMGITHHSNYIRFMEEARIDWLDQLGYGFDRGHRLSRRFRRLQLQENHHVQRRD